VRGEGMKKEIQYRILSTLLAIIIVLGVCSVAYNIKIHDKSINLYLDKIDGLNGNFEAYSTKNEKVLTDKVEELARDNERLSAENAALKDYIKGFKDKFWKEGKK
jgi:cell division protein FtsB